MSAFFFLQLPILSQVSTYHSDEHFYTNSAIYMLNHGEYATPCNEDGSLRTKKPIITYWALMVSFALLGIHFFAARLPFFIAGCLTVCLTYLLSLKIFNNKKWALLAAAILAANFQFITLCLRATPDILQVLFINISLYGFISLTMHKDKRLQNFIFAYFGAAAAVETKGLLGLVPVAYILIHIIVSRLSGAVKKDVTFKDIVHWPVIFISIVLASGWYLFIVAEHGEAALGSFLSDQVADKMTGTIYHLFINFKDYFLGVFRNFLPWTLILPIGYIVYRKTNHPRFKFAQKPAIFILGWFALLLFIFIGSSDCRTRYLVPAYPLLSVLSAALFFMIFDSRGVQQLWKWFCVLLFVFISIIAVVLTAAGFVLNLQLIFAGVILFVIGTAGLVVLFSRDRIFSPIGFAMILLIVVVDLRGLVLPAFEFAPSKKLTACLLERAGQSKEISVWSTQKHNYTRQIYTLSRGRVRVHYLSRNGMPENLEGRSLIILTRDELSFLEPGYYEIRQCAYLFDAPPMAAVRKVVSNGKREAVITIIKKPIYVARRKAAPGNEF